MTDLDAARLAMLAAGGETLDADAGESAPIRRFRLLTESDLRDLPQLEPLIVGVLERGTVALMVAPYASFKSFVALDMALNVALGRPWHGRATTQGDVVYIYAEGTTGILRRVEAWKAFHGIATVPGVYFLPSAPLLNVPKDAHEVMAELALLPKQPALIVVDTVARTISGNERESVDMNAYIRACDRMTAEAGATVLLVHHTGWEGTRSRGATELPAGAQTEIILKRDGDQVDVTLKKQKDGEDGISVAHLEAVKSGESLALRPVVPNSSSLTVNERRALSVVQASEGMTSTEWKSATTLAQGSFANARNRLLSIAYVRVAKKRYTATEAGRQALGTTYNGGTTEVQSTPAPEVQHPHIPKDVGCVPSRPVMARIPGTCMLCQREGLEDGAAICPRGEHLAHYRRAS